VVGRNDINPMIDTGHIVCTIKKKRKNKESPERRYGKICLKEPEDFLVGQSIVMSSEFLLKKYSLLLSGKECAVFGYGKIGRSISRCLSARSISTKIVEIDPILSVQALSVGFPISSKEKVLRTADVIFSCTGNKNLKVSDLHTLKNNAIIISVTSADDEFSFINLEDEFHTRSNSTEICLLESNVNQKRFYLANRGNAMNFMFGDYSASLGNFIRLVQAEIIIAITELLKGKAVGFYEVDEDTKRRIADTWLTTYHDKGE
jgi:adenosylhomocysteinase